MQAIFDVALPVFAIVLCGYLAGRTKILGLGMSEALNGFTYYFALPALFFIATARTPIAQILDWPFLATTLSGICIVYALSYAIATFAFRDSMGARGLHALAAIFANTGYMGVPLFVAAFGEQGTVPAILSAVSQSMTILLVSIALIELDASQSTSRLGIARDMFYGIVGNPLLIASAAGIALNLSGLGVPTAFETFFKLLGAAAGPCALFAVGLFMVGKKLSAGMGEVAVITVAKLLVLPAVTWLLGAYVFDLSDTGVRDATLASSLPTGALVFVLAQKYNVFVERTSAAVLATTVLSVITVSAVMIIFGVR